MTVIWKIIFLSVRVFVEIAVNLLVELFKL